VSAALSRWPLHYPGDHYTIPVTATLSRWALHWPGYHSHGSRYRSVTTDHAKLTNDHADSRMLKIARRFTNAHADSRTLTRGFTWVQQLKVTIEQRIRANLKPAHFRPRSYISSAPDSKSSVGVRSPSGQHQLYRTTTTQDKAPRAGWTWTTSRGQADASDQSSRIPWTTRPRPSRRFWPEYSRSRQRRTGKNVSTRFTSTSKCYR